MKPEPIDLRGVTTVEELVERVVETRAREVRQLTAGLERRERRGLHDFRIACKRLRYALERFAELRPSLQAVAERLALLQDALGETRDRDLLLAVLPPSMPATERRLQYEREASVDRALALCGELEQTMRALDSHPI